MDNQLIIHRSQNDQSTLKKTIAKRKKFLMRWSDKYEQLRLQVDAIAEEYNYRIGRLYARDNVLDIEIIRFKKIKELMDLGIPYDDAVEEIKERYKKESEEIADMFNFDMPFDAPLFEEEGTTPQLRKLWKKLLHKFHPDLTTDQSEKEKRTEMMKTINHAYKKGDLQKLQDIDQKEAIDHLESHHSVSIEELEQALVTIENAIIRIKSQHKELKSSEWFSWTELTKKARNNLLEDMEIKIKDDIVVKEKLLDDLKRQVEK